MNETIHKFGLFHILRVSNQQTSTIRKWLDYPSPSTRLC